MDWKKNNMWWSKFSIFLRAQELRFGSAGCSCAMEFGSCVFEIVPPISAASGMVSPVQVNWEAFFNHNTRCSNKQIAQRLTTRRIGLSRCREYWTRSSEHRNKAAHVNKPKHRNHLNQFGNLFR